MGYQIIGQDKMPSECSPFCPESSPGVAFEPAEFCATACQITEGTNFLTLESADSFEKFKSGATTDFVNGFFSFQLAWKVDECNVVVLEWKQANNPLIKQVDNTIEITSFKEIKCTITDPALVALKKISFSNENFFINCPAAHRQETKLAVDETNNGFTGLTLNDNEADAYILSGSADGLYSFGQMDYPDGSRIASYRLDGETQFSGEMQLSVNICLIRINYKRFITVGT